MTRALLDSTGTSLGGHFTLSAGELKSEILNGDLYFVGPYLGCDPMHNKVASGYLPMNPDNIRRMGTA